MLASICLEQREPARNRRRFHAEQAGLSGGKWIQPGWRRGRTMTIGAIAGLAADRRSGSDPGDAMRAETQTELRNHKQNQRHHRL
jgi:hypothetical protein